MFDTLTFTQVIAAAVDFISEFQALIAAGLILGISIVGVRRLTASGR